MNLRIKSTLILLLCTVLLFTAVPVAGAASAYAVNGANGEVILPIDGYGPGARSTNCWTFAQTVFKYIWGVNFTGIRGTDYDMLRSVPAGSARAITTENTRNFISAAALGSTIRITTYIDGDDNNGRYKHSMILIQKDEEGFTVYEGSINGRVRIKYYTFSEFANGYFGRNYGYYKYIKWPGAPAYGEEPEEEASPETEPVTCVSAANLQSFVAGDVDNDGMVTPADARFALRYAVQLETLDPGAAAHLAGDMDNDGDITSADARYILRAAVQLTEDQLPDTADTQ